MNAAATARSRAYLDDIQLQYEDSPEVYEEFLEIMKDYRSDLIDSITVIERITVLFYQRPSLLRGFNAFLPNGYYIDTTRGASNETIVTITTPSGTRTRAMGRN